MPIVAVETFVSPDLLLDGVVLADVMYCRLEKKIETARNALDVVSAAVQTTFPYSPEMDHTLQVLTCPFRSCCRAITHRIPIEKFHLC
jgi:hypothetical protein